MPNKNRKGYDELIDMQFLNNQCKYYPCHKDSNLKDFSCLLCYCPLYYYNCGKNFTFTEDGLKDCSSCIYPHLKSSYIEIIDIMK